MSSPNMGTLIQRTRDGKKPRGDPFWDDKRKPFIIGVAMSFVMVQIMITAATVYVYGGLFESATRVRNLAVLYVDFDGGIIGQSMSAAYHQLEGKTFPRIETLPASDFSSPADVMQLFRDEPHYWGAVYTTSGASDRLTQALGGGDAAAHYNATDAVYHITNGARYASASEGSISINLLTWDNAARLAYNEINGTKAAYTLPQNDTEAASILLDPWTATSIDICAVPSNTKFLYNTISMAVPVVEQFFFMMAFNAISAEAQLFNYLPTLDLGLMRWSVGVVFTFISSLTQAGYTWGFKEGWGLSGSQFVLMWMICWLWHNINFQIVEIMTAYVPIKFLTFCIFPWALVNVGSTIFPVELSSRWYRVSYAIPSYNTYQVLITIWSGGAANRLYFALPVLFSWWVVTGLGAARAVVHRSKKARQEAEAMHQAAVLEKEQHEKLGESGTDTAVDSDKASTGDLPTPVPRRGRNRNSWQQGWARSIGSWRDSYYPSLGPAPSIAPSEDRRTARTFYNSSDTLADLAEVHEIQQRYARLNDRQARDADRYTRRRGMADV